MNQKSQQESEIKEAEKFIEALNQQKFTYHILLALAVFFICLAFIMIIGGEGKDVGVIYKVFSVIFNVASGVMAAFAVRAEIAYKKTLKGCPHCKKNTK